MSRMNSLVLGALAATLAMAPAAFAADPSPAQPAAPAKAATKASSSTKAHHSSSTHHTAKVNLNTATKEDLMKLPGIDDATADKIIAARPFTSSQELVSK